MKNLFRVRISLHKMIFAEGKLSYFFKNFLFNYTTFLKLYNKKSKSNHNPSVNREKNCNFNSKLIIIKIITCRQEQEEQF